MQLCSRNIIELLINLFSPRRITVKRNFMRQGFYECNEHNRKNRKKAIEEMPYASKVVAVVGGYMGLERR